MRNEWSELSPYELESEFERLWDIQERLLADGRVQEAEAVLIELYDLKTFMVQD